jgi:integrase
VTPPLRLKIAELAPETVAVPLDDVERLLAEARDEQGRVAVLLATEAGLRAGETRGLHAGDIRGG